MKYIEAVKAGVGLINRNWQLVVIQFALSVAGCMGFFIIVGAPLIIIFVMLGIDLAELGSLKDMLANIEGPGEFIQKYLGIAIVLAFVILIYLVLMSFIWIYYFGGSAGLIKKAVRGPESKFTMGEFLAEGKRLFIPLTGYLLLAGVVFAGVMFVFGMVGGVAVYIPGLFDIGTLTGMVLKVFFALVIALVGFIVLTGLFAVSLHGGVLTLFDGTGAAAALSAAFGQLKKRPEIVGFYALLLSGYVISNFIIAIIGFPFKLIPIVGTILMMPYQLLSYLIQSYLCLVVLASAIVYYDSISGGSTPPEGTSPEEESPQVPLPGM